MHEDGSPDLATAIADHGRGDLWSYLGLVATHQCICYPGCQHSDIMDTRFHYLSSIAGLGERLDGYHACYVRELPW